MWSSRSRAGLAVDAAAFGYERSGQGGLLSVSPKLRADERRCVRTAKPCGPGRRCYGQALAEAAFASTGAVSATSTRVREARGNSAPGRARHKPSNHCAGKAVCLASPVCRCAVFFALHARSGPWVPAGTRPSLRPLGQEGGAMKQSSGEMRRENAKACLLASAETL